MSIKPVNDSTSGKNLAAYNTRNGTNSAWQNESPSDDLFNVDFGIDKLEEEMDEARLYSSDLGGAAFNPRVREAYIKEIMENGKKFENLSIADDDKDNLEPLSKIFDRYRIFGMRVHHKEEMLEVLKESKKAGNGVALYLTNCAKDGLKDPNQPISFENLKNPLRLAKTLMSASLVTPEANEKINLLSDIALDSPEMAACLLEATADGGLTGIGVDSATAKKLLVDSREKFDNEADYHKFVSNTNIAYKNMFGKNLDHYLEENYKTVLDKASPFGGIAAGAAIGARFGKFGALAGATIGGLAGLAAYSSSFFGINEDGEELHNAITKSRQNSHNINIEKYTAFGSLSGMSS